MIGCLTKNCLGNATKHRRVCSKCRSAMDAENNPLTYSYRKWKSNAKRRGIPFDVTLEQYKEFCNRTGYLVGRGMGANHLTIDRIVNHLGYTYSNIECVTKSENVKRQRKGISGLSIPIVGKQEGDVF